MSRKRRGFLDRDDALDGVSTHAPSLPEELNSMEEEPVKGANPSKAEARHSDVGFDLDLPESLEEPMPGFFGWDDEDEVEGPPTEEVPNVPIDAWADEFSPPLSVPEAPPLEGIIDGYTPVLLAPKPEDIAAQEDAFDALFEEPPPSKKPERKLPSIDPIRLLLLIVMAIVLGLGVGSILAYVLFVYDSGDTPTRISPPTSILVKKEMVQTASQPQQEQSAVVQSVDAKEALPQGTLRIEYTGSDDVSIWVDGTLFGGPPITTMVDGGEHSIRAVVTNNPKKKMKRTVTVQAGEQVQLDVVF